ncbi:MAG: hypothetical protein K0Q97_1682 [Bacillota bacterium]|jgi:hypothetical protein|nr:hypothetical protein [Bacillota bacterium]
MSLLTALIIIIGGLLFFYFNFVLSFKINVAITFVMINIDFIFFKKIYSFNKCLYYEVLIRKLLNKYHNRKTKIRYNTYYKKFEKYKKYFDRVLRIFFIKNIYLYPESCNNQSSMAIEFNVVNIVLKNPLIKKHIS